MDNLCEADYVPETVVIPRSKEKSLSPSNVWRPILTVSDEAAIEVFEQGIRIFEGKASKTTSSKAKRANQWDKAEVSNHIARCCLWVYLRHASRTPTLFDTTTNASLVKMWRSGIAPVIYLSSEGHHTIPDQCQPPGESPVALARQSRD